MVKDECFLGAIMSTYNTVKTMKIVDKDEDRAARRAIYACGLLTPETEANIDFALGIGTMNLSPADLDESHSSRLRAYLRADEIVDIMDVAGPSEAALDNIEAEQE